MLCHHDELTKEFEALLSTFPDHYYCDGLSRLPQITVHENDGTEEHTIDYPIEGHSLSKLKAVARKSRFGRGTRTVYDQSTRNSLELDSDQFIIQDFEFDSTKSLLLEDIRKKLMPHVDFITAQPYKLIIYEKDGFFNKHKDHKSSRLHFGSLILQLPSIDGFGGGQLILEKHNSRNIKRFQWSLHDKKRKPNLSQLQCPYLAFYTDINHEIERITDGVRVSLVFELCINEAYFNDFNKYNRIALNNEYKDPPASKKEYLQIKSSKKTGLQKIKKIRGLNLVSSRANGGDQIWKLLIDAKICGNTILLNPDICFIIASYASSDVMTPIANIVKDGDCDGRNFVSKYVQFESYNGSCYDHACTASILVVFEYEYSGNIVHPLTLKGRDIFVYEYFQKYMFVYPLALSVNFNVQQIEPYGDDCACDPYIELGNQYVQTPHFLGKIDDLNQAYMLYVGEKENTLQELHFAGSGRENDLGNEGAYQIWDIYHVCGLLMRPYFPNAQDETFTKNV